MRIIILILLLTNSANLHGMRIKDGSTKINFNNQTKSIAQWIKLCAIHPTHPFTQTKIYYYKNNTFILQGTVQSLNKKNVEKIYQGNAIFCSNYQLIKKTTQGSIFKKVSVLLVGGNTLKAFNQFYSQNGVSLDNSIKLQSKL